MWINLAGYFKFPHCPLKAVVGWKEARKTNYASAPAMQVNGDYNPSAKVRSDFARFSDGVSNPSETCFCRSGFSNI